MAERILGDVLRVLRGRSSRTAPENHSFPTRARSGKTSVLIKKVLCWGGGRPEPISCSSTLTMGWSWGMLSVPLPHPGHGKGQTLGLMAWKPTKGWRRADV